MFEIIILAKASQRKIFLPVTSEQLDWSLLDFLRAKEIPIASSCKGEGICKKCMVNSDLLSCEMKVRYFVEEKLAISVDYL